MADVDQALLIGPWRLLPLGWRLGAGAFPLGQDGSGLLALSPKVLTDHFLQNSSKFSSFEPFIASIQVHYFKKHLTFLLQIILKM